jgi:hypothetical protein
MHPTGATSYGRSKTNVSNKVERNVPPNSPEAVYIQPRVPKWETRGFPNERSRSRAAEGPEPHHKDAVNERRSSLNIEPKRKLTNSSVKPREQVSSSSPTARNGAVYAQPQVPKRDYGSKKGPVANTTAGRECQDDVKCRPRDVEDARVETRQYSTRDISHASRDATRSCVEKGGESFGIGVSANARDGTSAKYLTSTMINRCNGERGRHNY